MDSPIDKVQTKGSFGSKWSENPNLSFHELLDENFEITQWVLRRNGFSSFHEFKSWLGEGTRILDGGCGNGRVTQLLATLAPNSEIVGIDINPDIAALNLQNFKNVTIHYQDLLNLDQELGLFDRIYCQEVLHHTADPKLGFSNLVDKLLPGGEIAIYVYKIKGPIREYVDEYIRGLVSELPWESAAPLIAQITELGRVLSEEDLILEIPEVEILGIKEGRYSIQRFIYHFFLKCFWNESFSFKDNNAVNLDWYHPSLASKHSLEEITSWFEVKNLEIMHSYVDEYGITVRGKKKETL